MSLRQCWFLLARRFVASLSPHELTDNAPRNKWKHNGALGMCLCVCRRRASYVSLIRKEFARVCV